FFSCLITSLKLPNALPKFSPISSAHTSRAKGYPGQQALYLLARAMSNLCYPWQQSHHKCISSTCLQDY
ncbi:MAG TPA: hypothetical protein VKA92_04925, partial [Segetibacter sp.]|nr:hypothetical protein [Segetibacter sp.]